MYYHPKGRRCIVKPMLIKCVVIVTNDITGKLREQKLITKEHIATQKIILFVLTCYILQYFSDKTF